MYNNRTSDMRKGEHREMQVAKHETMRSVNTATLLSCLLDNGPLTRQELQKRTGLSWGAVSNIVSELLTLNILCESQLKSSHAGRKPSVVDINPKDNLCIGVDIHMQGIACVITDLRGQTLVSLRRSIEGASRQEVLERAADAIFEAMETLKAKKESIIGIGVSIQGSIDRTNRISIYSPHQPEWSDVAVCSFLEERFDLPALLFHDTIAMIIAERRHSAHNVRNMAFVKLDMGLGLSMVLNDQLYTGSDGNASEFGHIIIDPQGPLCTCGNHGCLEAHVSGRSILEQVRKGIAKGKSSLKLPGKGFEGDLAAVAHAARQGSSFEKELFEAMGGYFGLGISNLINFINPELVVLGGEMAQYSDLYLDRAMEVIRKNVWNTSRIQLELSTLGSNGAAVGAAMSLLRQTMNGHIPHAIGSLFRTLHTAMES